MRILLQGRKTSGERRGGDATLASRVAAELEGLGHEVTIAASLAPDAVGGFDAVHAVNLDRSVLAETEAVARAATQAGVPLVITPLWWPLDAYIASLPLAQRLAFQAKGLGAARALHDRQLSSMAGVHKRQAAVLAAATAVCPSGAAEGRALEAAFGPLPLRVVQFGTGQAPPPGPADGATGTADDGPTRGAGDRTGVLCVARLDPRKNQLSLIRALAGTGLRLRLVGTPTVFPDYARACREAAAAADLAGTVEFTGFLPDSEVDQALRSARVHALPSFFELPGLTSLDAAAAGAAVVASTAGTAVDYFGDGAIYCATDASSIRTAVLAAYEAGPPPGLSDVVATRFTWRACAEGYLSAYSGRTTAPGP